MKIESEADRILSALAELQLLAVEFSRSSTALEHGSALWVAFVADAACPWRLVETERSSNGRLRRKRMLCFRSHNEILQAAEERLAWTITDEQFRANHMSTVAGLPGVTGDWVPSKDFESIFATTRRLMREGICTTRSIQTVMLA
jgi:hypothetical protein